MGKFDTNALTVTVPLDVAESWVQCLLESDEQACNGYSFAVCALAPAGKRRVTLPRQSVEQLVRTGLMAQPEHLPSDLPEF